PEAFVTAHYGAVQVFADDCVVTGPDDRCEPTKFVAPPPRWSDHVESWLSVPFPVHLLRYEDMLAHPRATVTALARFLGLSGEPETIAIAVESTSFTRLQAQERVAGSSRSRDAQPPSSARARRTAGATC